MVNEKGYLGTFDTREGDLPIPWKRQTRTCLSLSPLRFAMGTSKASL